VNAVLQVVYLAGMLFSHQPTSLTSGDFNGDGLLDLAIGSPVEPMALLGNGEGRFLLKR
jgi:hypothetical protein